ncbi:MAG: hypothetical protein FJ137_22485 [Deltaproteobacteria bacterium]|nr:hypothetical protein [Deltaproteobacteria bacterium]
MTKMKKQSSEPATRSMSLNPLDGAPTAGFDGEFEDIEVPVAADTHEARSRRFKEVWLVEDRKNARSVWTRVGAAFENADGSWNIKLSAVPLGGRLNVRDPLPRERAVEA